MWPNMELRSSPSQALPGKALLLILHSSTSDKSLEEPAHPLQRQLELLVQLLFLAICLVITCGKSQAFTFLFYFHPLLWLDACTSPPFLLTLKERTKIRTLVSFVRLGWFGFIRKGYWMTMIRRRVPVNTKWPVDGV